MPRWTALVRRFVAARDAGEVEASDPDLARFRAAATQLELAVWRSGKSTVIGCHTGDRPPVHLRRQKQWGTLRLVEKQWTALHRGFSGQAMGRQAKTLAGDIETSEMALLASRVAMLAVAKGLQPELREVFGDASQAMEEIRAGAQSGTISENTAKQARAAFLRYFGALASQLEAQELKEAQREWRGEQVFVHSKPKPDTSCIKHHTTPNKTIHVTRQPYRAPPQRSPGVRMTMSAVQGASSVEEWQQVQASFRWSMRLLDELLFLNTPSDTKAGKSGVHARKLLDRQTDLMERQPKAKKIPAVFFPHVRVGDVLVDGTYVQFFLPKRATGGGGAVRLEPRRFVGSEQAFVAELNGLIDAGYQPIVKGFDGAQLYAAYWKSATPRKATIRKTRSGSSVIDVESTEQPVRKRSARPGDSPLRTATNEMILALSKSRSTQWVDLVGRDGQNAAQRVRGGRP